MTFDRYMEKLVELIEQRIEHIGWACYMSDDYITKEGRIDRQKEADAAEVEIRELILEIVREEIA